jgi:hypothetical protein
MYHPNSGVPMGKGEIVKELGQLLDSIGDVRVGAYREVNETTDERAVW